MNEDFTRISVEELLELRRARIRRRADLLGCTYAVADVLETIEDRVADLEQNQPDKKIPF